jgi:uncharacterized protein
MPRGRNSHLGESEGAQRPVAVTEPGEERARSRRQTDAGVSERSDEVRGLQAKEPERKSASRHSSQSSRRPSMDSGEDEPRARSAQRAANRRGTQSRRVTDRAETARRTASPEARTGRQKKSRRGFAAMTPEQQRDIARKGGLTVSRNRRHMADIGRVGGEHSHGGRRVRR